MDSRLEGKFPSKAAFCITQLSMKCLASEPKHRPSMKDVLENLERIQAANEKPVEPKFRSTHAASRQGHQAVHHRSPRQDDANTIYYRDSPNNERKKLAPTRKSVVATIPLKNPFFFNNVDLLLQLGCGCSPSWRSAQKRSGASAVEKQRG
ncbi:hypothetical protein JHK85_039156 [Glycine max]|nr:hypothetical protein JHK85_039156 [Glycine max]